MEADLKVVVLVNPRGKTTVGVQEKGADPVMEQLEGADLSAALAAVPVLLDRARAQWAERRQGPAYEPPAPPTPTPQPAAAKPAGARAAKKAGAAGEGWQMARLM